MKNEKYWQQRFEAVESGANRAAASAYAKIERNIMSAQRVFLSIKNTTERSYSEDIKLVLN